jgi:hypothetical protein
MILLKHRVCFQAVIWIYWTQKSERRIKNQKEESKIKKKNQTQKEESNRKIEKSYGFITLLWDPEIEESCQKPKSPSNFFCFTPEMKKRRKKDDDSLPGVRVN